MSKAWDSVVASASFTEEGGEFTWLPSMSEEDGDIAPSGTPFIALASLTYLQQACPHLEHSSPMPKLQKQKPGRL
jgi:hypothetical protein